MGRPAPTGVRHPLTNRRQCSPTTLPLVLRLCCACAALFLRLSYRLIVLATPPCRAHAPLADAACENVPSLHCAVAPAESCAAFSSALLAFASALFANAAARGGFLRIL